jgi:hypothetical protein
MVPIVARLGLVAVYTLIAGRMLYHSRKQRPGMQRLPIALFIVACNAAVPFLFHPSLEICTFSMVGLQLMWLASFKTLGWVVNRGPLTEMWLTFPQFVAVFGLAITPVIPKSHMHAGSARQAESGNTAVAGLLGFGTKLVGLAAVVLLVQDPRLPRLACEFCYAVGLYLFVSSVMDAMGCVTVGVLGLTIAPHFDAPYLSSSLADYWSRRWNLTVGYVLRVMCYDPILEGEFRYRQFVVLSDVLVVQHCIVET